MWRRASREPRILVAIALLALALPGGWYVKHQADAQADDDFALCGSAIPAAECVSKQLPTYVTETRSVGTGGYSHKWSISVQTSGHSSFTMGGLAHDAVRPFENSPTAEVRYRQGRMTAIVAADGTSLKVPFAFTRRSVVSGAIVGICVLAAGGLIAWGFTRVNRPAPATTA